MDEWRNNKLPERLPAFSKKRLPKKVILSYILDYVIIVVLLAIFMIIDKVEPFHQPFSLDNYTLHYPFATKERITVFSAALIAVVFPAFVIVVYTLVIDGIFSHQTAVPAHRSGLKRLTGRYRLKDRLWELNCGLLGLMLSVCAAFTITGALKNAIGKPRPDLISRCMVDTSKIKDPKSFELDTIAICTQKDNYILQDGFKSFPSAHSSVGFGGLFYLSLYLAAKLHVLDSKGEVWKAFIVMVPSLAAALVAGSRIMDARHHPFDVISGSLLGILVAWGSYRQYFPPVSETWRKGRAYPIRSWGREPAPPPHVLHTEEDILPLRSGPTDEERGEASGFSTQPVVAATDEHGGNVFRQQISQSQRRRQQEGHIGIQPSDTLSSNYSTQSAGAPYRGQLSTQNPFSNAARRNDAYEYSSSEDEDGYEMSNRYPNAAATGPVYNPVSGTMTDTGYHPAAGRSPQPSPPLPGTAPPTSAAGDLAGRTETAPAPQHVPPPPAAATKT